MHLATKADLPFIESVMNHPTVRPHVWPGTEYLNCAEAIETMWTLVVPGAGVMMGEALGDGNYLALTAFLPGARGLEAVVQMRRAIYKIFTETDCSCLYASVKPSNRIAARNLVGLGFKDIEHRNNRITAKINYLDILDEQCFKDTAKNGWSGKALYWWGVKSRIEDVPMMLPIHPTLPIFASDGEVIDLTEAK